MPLEWLPAPLAGIPRLLRDAGTLFLSGVCPGRDGKLILLSRRTEKLVVTCHQTLRHSVSIALRPEAAGTEDIRNVGP